MSGRGSAGAGGARSDRVRISQLLNPPGLYRSLRVAQEREAVALERLATGKRINRGKDDPSGMVAAEYLKVDLATLTSKLKGMERTSAFLGSKDGALSAVGDLLLELKGIVVSAGNADVLSDAEREGLQVEAESILAGLDHVSRTAIFNDQNLLRGYDSNGLGLGGGVLDLFSGDLESAEDAVEAALERVNGERGRIGGRLKGLDAERNAMAVAYENVAGALSLIEDTDIAAEASELIRNQILEQAAISVIDMSKQNAESALLLLEGAVEMSRRAGKAA